MAERVFAAETPLKDDFVAFKRRLLSIDPTYDLEDNAICIIKYTRDGARYLLLNEVILLSGEQQTKRLVPSLK